MRVLVTGSSGYIGTHLIHMLLEQGHEIITCDILDGVDVRRPSDLYQRFNDHYPIDVVIHLAALISVPESEKYPLQYFNTNTNSIIHILNTMKTFNCTKIIFASTAAVYHVNSTINSLSEDSPTHPLSVYGKSKWLAEEMITTISPCLDIDYIIFRFFNVAGTCDQVARPRGRGHPHLIPSIIERYHRKEPIILYGNDYPTRDGTCIRDYIHVMDVCKGIALGLKKMETQHYRDIINLGSNHGYTVNEVISAVNAVTPDPLTICIADRRVGDPAHLIANTDRARERLDWSPQYSLDEMIQSTLKYWTCEETDAR